MRAPIHPSIGGFCRIKGIQRNQKNQTRYGGRPRRPPKPGSSPAPNPFCRIKEFKEIQRIQKIKEFKHWCEQNAEASQKWAKTRVASHSAACVPQRAQRRPQTSSLEYGFVKFTTWQTGSSSGFVRDNIEISDHIEIEKDFIEISSDKLRFDEIDSIFVETQT